MDNRAFSMGELMVAVICTVLLMTGVYSFYTVASQSYSTGITGQTLQEGSNIVISKIIEGDTESGSVYRLSTAASYSIPNGTLNHLYTCGGAPQIAPCDPSQPASELIFTAKDDSTRWYYLNHSGSAVMYHYPGEVADKPIYTAPKNSKLTLRFSPATSAAANVVEIDAALTENVSGGTTTRLATNGSASTYVLLRDH